MPKIKTTMLGAGAVLFSLGSLNAAAQVAAQSDFPAVFPPLPAYLPTEQKLERLGAQKLSKIAKWYGWSTEQFTDEVTRFFPSGSQLLMDGDGRLYNEEKGNLTNPEPPRAHLPNSSYAFKLASRPGASKTIYLNFKNADVAGSSLPGFSLDPRPAGSQGGEHDLSWLEAHFISEIWKSVADDYAPFDVNVTTAEPDREKLTRSSAADEAYGTTVYIHSLPVSTGTAIKAYVKSFGEQKESVKPILINTALLGNNIDNIAGAVSYALGHAMGLRRNATLLDNPGPASYALETSELWSPIMGSYLGYKVRQFRMSLDLKETPALDESEDEFAVLQRNGLSLRSDDFADDQSKATILNPGSRLDVAADAREELARNGYFVRSSRDPLPMAQISGVTERHRDQDVFVSNARSGSMWITVTPERYISRHTLQNANLEVTLHDSVGGPPLVTANPRHDSRAELYYYAPRTGAYYIKVRGAGENDASSGYSSYGARGNYVVSVDWQRSQFVAPTAVLEPSRFLIRTGQPVSFDFSASSDDRPGLQYMLDPGDGRVPSFSPQVFTNVTYARPGTYTATLTVRDSDNQVGIARKTIRVIDRAPVVSPLPAVITMVRADSQITSRIFRAQPAEQRTAASYEWDWGDGTKTVTEASTVAHQFPRLGSYNVTVRVNDTGNRVHVGSLTAEIAAPSLQIGTPCVWVSQANPANPAERRSVVVGIRITDTTGYGMAGVNVTGIAAGTSDGPPATEDYLCPATEQQFTARGASVGSDGTFSATTDTKGVVFVDASDTYSGCIALTIRSAGVPGQPVQTPLPLRTSGCGPGRLARN